MTNEEIVKELMALAEETKLIQYRITELINKLGGENTKPVKKSALTEEQILYLRKKIHDRMFKERAPKKK